MRPPPWSFELPDSTTACRRRRAFVDYLRAYGRADDDYGSAELIFGELVTNALLHAPGPIEVHAEWSSGHATLHVTDEGLPLNLEFPNDPGPLAERGRGILIVRRLSPNVVGTIYPGYGKTISAALPVCPR
jgi:anti-sigma regulatory factor (Ser/Thr protein kinase)